MRWTGAALLATVLTGVGILSPAPSWPATPAQIDAIENQRRPLGTTDDKIASPILSAVTGTPTKATANGALRPTRAEELGAVRRQQSILLDVDVITITENLRHSITALQGSIVSESSRYNGLRILLPLGAVRQLAARDDVTFVQQAVRYSRNGFDSLGDQAIRTAEMRQRFHVDGAGVKVGVLSDSADTPGGDLNQAFASGGLQRNAFHIVDYQAGSGTGEGLAMLEIIHAIAPGATLDFATANGSPKAMADNIQALIADGCNIIVDDITYDDESPFQDGPIASAVADASARGVLYFSSAGNSGSLSSKTSSTWEGDFRAGPSAEDAAQQAGSLLEFAPGVAFNTVDSVDAPTSRVDLFWSDPLKHATNEYDLFVRDAGGNVVGSSTTAMRGKNDPYQHVDLSGTHPQLVAGDEIVVVQRPGAQGRFLHIDAHGAHLRFATAGATRGHNAASAQNAFSVAAVPAPSQPFDFYATPSMEPFSSDGPRRMFYDRTGNEYTPGNVSGAGGRVFQKPDIAGIDGIDTPVQGFETFYGTSAAAPHAAGIAALILSVNRNFSPEQVRFAMRVSSLPFASSGAVAGPSYGLATGYGVRAAVSMAAIPTISASAYHRVRLARDGSLEVAGFEDCPAQVPHIVPPAVQSVIAVAAGASLRIPCQDYNLAIAPDGSVLSWGSVLNALTFAKGSRGTIAVTLGKYAFALDTTGQVTAWDPFTHSTLTLPPTLQKDVLSLSELNGTALAVKFDGSLVGWSDHNSSLINTIPADLKDVKSVSVGGENVLALLHDGTVRVWGPGQCNVPFVAGLSDIAAISDGYSAVRHADHCLALKRDGTVTAWGDNWFGAILVPQTVKDVKAIAAAASQSFAIRGDGLIASWGVGPAVPGSITSCIAFMHSGDCVKQ
jgi:hypothetical protein